MEGWQGPREARQAILESRKRYLDAKEQAGQEQPAASSS
jgi:hypothetical protein